MQNNTSNLIAAVILSMLILFGWHFFFEKPRIEKLAAQNKAYSEQIKQEKIISSQNVISSTQDRSESIKEFKRIKIFSDKLSGSISLKGLRFDDLTLTNYKQNLDKDSPPIELFSPSNTEIAYFAEMGWLGDNGLIVPDADTVWSSDKDSISAGESVVLNWISPEKVVFQVEINLNEDYLFSIKQNVINNQNKSISMRSYGLINRAQPDLSKTNFNIVHQGMIGSSGNNLQEYNYDQIKDKRRITFDKNIDGNTVNWLGITDKYWLSSFIPDKNHLYSGSYNYARKSGQDRFQADFTSDSQIISSGNNFTFTHHLFAGPKKVDLLDKYEERFEIPLFDRAIDFGWFYILTKPIFNAMNFCYSYVGNFGISIMIVTVLIKLMMFTLANKSFRSMKKMKKLQPEMERLKELYPDDKTKLNQEVMELYKREKVNPLSGCLPLIVQIPVFFSIYKVLNVTIEMRHAPFFGWITDLSAPDPTSIFNLFGLLPFTPISFLMIGAWPIIMAITMFLQQRMSPQPADPVQAQMMKLLPLIFLFMFSNFPAGLLIYWSWNNILSILQQLSINKLDK